MACSFREWTAWIPKLDSPTQGDEADTHLVHSIEVGRGGKLGIEDQLTGKSS